jgi:hypothetical protein
MPYRILLLLSVLLIVFVQASAQDDEFGSVGVIRVKKKIVLPDTGRYKVPLYQNIINPGFLRGDGGVFAARMHDGSFFAGVQYFQFTYLQLGVESKMIRKLFSFGFNFEANVDKKIYGASIFLERPVLTFPFLTASAGAVSSIYLSRSASDHSAGPYIAINPTYKYLHNFQLSYGYNYIFSGQPGYSNEIKGSRGSMNTHTITLRYRVPFYL